MVCLNTQTTMYQNPEVTENTMDGGFFMSIFRYILIILFKPWNYIVETHLRLYSAIKMFFLITDCWSDLMSFILVQCVSPYYKPPWQDVFKDETHPN